MDKPQAQRLVKDTLENPFDKQNFIGLIRNILNDFDEKTFVYKGGIISKDFSDSINVVERIGKYEDANQKAIDILVIKLKKESTLDRARTKQRNYVAKYLRGSRGGKLKDAALVAFVSPNQKDWRFSFVKMEYKFDEQGKVNEDLTPARRYSFLVGKNESSHTAQSCLLPILQNDKNPCLEDLESAFSVEKVTKEFFEKYRGLFFKLKEDLDKVLEQDSKIKSEFKDKNVLVADFSKKLLGQIVFIYFLQKKGWFGVKKEGTWGSGSKAFMRELFKKDHCDYENFFNDILEPLFYEALQRERSDDYYSRFNCRIPFLNGGLFDPINNYDWVNTDILLSNELFSNKKQTKEGDIGDGILDIFDRYNFTVKEDEPLEKEVAVDPEMLGKVFENLLEVKDRKSKGTYYTPREIVHYMCQESLTNYLETELKGINKEDIEILIKHGEAVIENERQVIKQGATKTYSHKLPEVIRQQASVIDHKLANIRICDPAIGSGAFPVGMMNEIIKARSTLTPFIKSKSKRDAYHFKLHAIQHCLYGVDIDPGAIEIAKLRLWLSLVVDEDERQNIQPLPNLDYKIVCGNSLLDYPYKPHGLTEIEKLKEQFFKETHPNTKEQLREQIDEKINLLFANTQKLLGYKVDFSFKINFSEVFSENQGFDVIIANPPYVNVFNIKDQCFRKYLRNNYSVAKNKTDLYAFFTEKGISILKNNGKLVFIFSNSWLGTNSFLKFRHFLINKTKIEKLIKCSQNVFQEATVTVLIISLSKTVTENQDIKLLELKNKTFYLLDHVLSYRDIKDQVEYGFTFEKIIKIKIPVCKLSDVGEFSLGIKTSNDKKFILSNRKDNDCYKVLQGKDINKYFIKFNNKWIWYKPDLMKKRKGAGPRELKNFLVPKILIKDVANTIQATLDEQRYLTTDTINILYKIKNYDFKFILGILNSKFINKWFKLNFSSGLHIKINQIKNIPLPYLSKLEQKPLILIVEKILNTTKSKDSLASDKQNKISQYEGQIDQLVYKLYGLTSEEIKIIEEN